MVDNTDLDNVVVTETWLKPDKGDGKTWEQGGFAGEFNIYRRESIFNC